MTTADDLRRKLGLYVQQGLGGAYPALKQLVGRIATDKVATWSWLPRTWISDYLALQGADGSALVRIAPAKVIVPDFCDTAEKQAAWNDLAAKVDAAVGKYAQGQADAGKVELEALYANARFWNEGLGAGIIKVTQTLADLPATIVGGVADGAGAVAGGVLKRLFSSWLVWVAILGAAGFFAWRAGLIKLPKAKGR